MVVANFDGEATTIFYIAHRTIYSYNSHYLAFLPYFITCQLKLTV